jgi:hypothetical protein
MVIDMDIDPLQYLQVTKTFIDIYDFYHVQLLLFFMKTAAPAYTSAADIESVVICLLILQRQLQGMK